MYSINTENIKLKKYLTAVHPLKEKILEAAPPWQEKILKALNHLQDFPYFHSRRF